MRTSAWPARHSTSTTTSMRAGITSTGRRCRKCRRGSMPASRASSRNLRAMPAPPDEYERVLAAHLELNPKSWAALQQRGVDEHQPLQLDFEFSAVDADAAR